MRDSMRSERGYGREDGGTVDYRILVFIEAESCSDICVGKKHYMIAVWE